MFSGDNLRDSVAALQQGLAAEAFVVPATAALDFQCHGSAEYPVWRALHRGWERHVQQPEFPWRKTSKNEKNTWNSCRASSWLVGHRLDAFDECGLPE